MTTACTKAEAVRRASHETNKIEQQRHHFKGSTVESTVPAHQGLEVRATGLPNGMAAPGVIPAQ